MHTIRPLPPLLPLPAQTPDPLSPTRPVAVPVAVAHRAANAARPSDAAQAPAERGSTPVAAEALPEPGQAHRAQTARKPRKGRSRRAQDAQDAPDESPLQRTARDEAPPQASAQAPELQATSGPNTTASSESPLVLSDSPPPSALAEALRASGDEPVLLAAGPTPSSTPVPVPPSTPPSPVRTGRIQSTVGDAAAPPVSVVPAPESGVMSAASPSAVGLASGGMSMALGAGGLVALGAMGGGGSGSTSTASSQGFHITTGTDWSLNENTLLVGSLAASTSATWALDASYGDGAKFTINTSTGALSFKNLSDANYELYASGSAVFHLKVTATSINYQIVGGTYVQPSQSQEITVHLIDVVNEENVVLTLQDAATSPISLDEATRSGGLIKVASDQGHDVSLVLTGPSGTVRKTVSSNGTLTLTSAEAAQLGDGAISVAGTTTDDKGHVSLPGSLSFVLDTVAPAYSGNVSLSVAENNPTVATLTASETVTWALDDNASSASADNALFKVGSSSGVLSWASTSGGNYELRELNPYHVRVKATDAAGNVSYSDLSVALTPVAIETVPSLALGNFVSGTVSQAEATQLTGLVRISGVPVGMQAELTFSRPIGGTRLTKTTGLSTGAALGLSLSASELAQLGDGAITVSAVNLDPKTGQRSAASPALNFTLDTLPPSLLTGLEWSVPENTATIGTLRAFESGLNWTLDNDGSSNAADNALFTLNASTGALSWASATGRDYEASTQAADGSHDYRLRILATDAAGNVSAQNLTVHLTDVNEPPSWVSGSIPSVATPVRVGQASPLAPLQVQDPDAGQILTVQIIATQGTVSVAGTGVSAIGSGSSNLLLWGTVADLNAALAKASFTASSAGSPSLTLKLVEGANNTAGLVDSPTQTYWLNAVASPVLQTLSVTEGASQGDRKPLSLTLGFSEAIHVTGQPSVVLQVGSNSAHTFTATYSSGSDSSTLVFSAPLGVPAGSNGKISVLSWRLGTDQSLTSVPTAANAAAVSLSTGVTGQFDPAYTVDSSLPVIGQMVTQYQTRNLLVSSRELAQTLLDNAFSDLGANGNVMSASDIAQFAALAGQYNTDGTKTTGGALGWALPSAYVPSYALAMQALQPGQMTSVPVQSTYGWHLIYLEATRQVAGSDSGAGTNFRVQENTPASQAIAQFTASKSGTTWSLTGADSARFSIDASGQLRLKQAANFESPDDANADHVYALNVVLTDAAGHVALRPITVTVTDVGQGGTVLVNNASTEGAVTAGQTLSASVGPLSDPWAGTQTSWRWQKQGIDGQWSDMAGATGTQYTVPAAQADTGLAVRAVATLSGPDGGVETLYSAAQTVKIAPQTAYTRLPGLYARTGTALSWTLPDDAFSSIGPLSYRMDGLAGTGLSFDASTRSLSGTWAGAGETSLTLTASQASGASQSLVMSITPVSGPWVQSLTVTDPVGHSQASPAGGGEALRVQVHFSEAMSASNPSLNTLQLKSGNQSFTAQYVSGNGSSDWVYQVASGAPAGSQGPVTLTGMSSASTVHTASGGLLENAWGQSDSHYQVDATAPVATASLVSATGRAGTWLNAGDVITAQMAFNEDVLLTLPSSGLPQLYLLVGGQSRSATYVAAQSTSRVLQFSYTVQSGDNDASGVQISAFNANGSSLTNLAGTAFGNSPGGLGVSNALFRVDTAAPAAPTLTLDSSLSAQGVNRSEALTAGLILVSGVPLDSTVAVSFSRSNNAGVVKTLAGTGNDLRVQLTPADLALLGHGLINVAAVTTDAAGNSTTAFTALTSSNGMTTTASGALSFTLDTLSPQILSGSLQPDSVSGTLHAPENRSAIATLQGSESGLTWKLDTSGGDATQYADNAKVQLGSDGSLSWQSPGGLDYEAVNAQRTFHVRVSATDAGGNVAYKNLEIDLYSVDEPPRVSTAATQAQAWSVSGGTLSGFSAVMVSDPDSATDTLYATLIASGGTLSGVADLDANLAGVQFKGTADQLQAQLAALRYVDDPTAANRLGDVALSLRVSAFRYEDTSPATSTTVALVTRQPQLAGAASPLSYTEGQASPLALFDGLSLSHSAADARIETVTVSIDSPLAGDTLSLRLDPVNMGLGLSQSFDATLGRLTVSSLGGTSVSQWQSVLQAVQYSSSADSPAGTRQISTRVFDAAGGSASLSQTLTVTGVDDAPVLSWPQSSASAPQHIPVGSASAILGASVMSSTLSDADSSILYMDLRADHGLLSLSSTPVGLVMTQDPATSEMKWSGPVSALRSALVNLRFTPSGDGAASLVYTLSDSSLAVADADRVGTHYFIASATADTSAPVLTPTGSAALSWTSPENTPTSSAIGSLADRLKVDESVLWSFASGGADNSLFSMNALTGQVYWKAVPDFETMAQSSAGTHVYTFKVQATDANGNVSSPRDITVELSNQPEAPVRTTTADVEYRQWLLPTSSQWTQPLATLFTNDSSLTGQYSLTALQGSSLPTWLSFNTATGELGVSAGQSLPTADASAQVLLTDHNAQGEASVALSLNWVSSTSRPMVKGLMALDSTGSSPVQGHAGELITVQVIFHQDVTVSGSPVATFMFGTGSNISFVTGTYVSESQGVLSFTVKAPSGVEGQSLVLDSLSGVIQSPVNGQSLATVTSGQFSAPYVLDNTAPQSPVIGLSTALLDGASASELMASGALTLQAEAGSTVDLTLSGVAGKVTRSLQAGLGLVPLALTPDEITRLGLGEVQLQAVATDPAGNTSLMGYQHFTVI